ncbi:hypothetical protein MWMV17_MWMV17_03458 [Acinetobacter calcoaceticus]|uniref:hypothetical protein n=1 Tax=Acinetobacter calcoaceticus TaxID=471 RepID=UPI0002F10713|nr:hypothetical protein [Acinetobacter calcoaceticus]CAI3162879.1 hypothetical protein MWMV17_MWMV17_03458 [Acinetobacter calcoaceticus]
MSSKKYPNSKKKKSSDWKGFIYCFLLIISVFGMWVGFPYALPHLHTITNTATYGTFGDSFGALNTLFSGLAFATLIITLILQSKELQLQRKAVQDQQLEIEKSNDIAEQQVLITEQQAELLEKQIKEAQVQNFFNILFPLLNRKKTYYEDADSLPIFGSSSALEHLKENGTFKKLHYGATTTYDKFMKFHGDENLHKDEILKTLKNMILNISPYIIPYSHLRASQYKEYFLYIINFIENFKGINNEDREVAMSIFLSDYSKIELYAISLLTLEDDVLMEKVIKHKVFNSFIEDDVGKSVFSLLFSE